MQTLGSMQNVHREAWEWAKLAGHLALFIGSFAFAGAAIQRRRWRENAGANWPTVQGHGQFVTVRDREGGNRLKHAVITYSYFLDEYRSGEYVKVFLREKTAWNFANRLKGKSVIVHYKPNKPSISTLRREELEQLLPTQGESRLEGMP